MKQKMQEVKDKVQDIFWMTKIVAKVVFYQIVVVLVAMGILYATNFKLSITKNVSIISPIPTVEVAHE